MDLYVKFHRGEVISGSEYTKNLNRNSLPLVNKVCWIYTNQWRSAGAIASRRKREFFIERKVGNDASIAPQYRMRLRFQKDFVALQLC